MFLLLIYAQVVSADVLVLQTGKSIRMESYSIEGATIRVILDERSELSFPLEWVREIRTTPRSTVSTTRQTKGKEFAYSDLVLSAARKHHLDWKLVAAVMAAESNFDPFAVSPKGALGLMQLMPDTAKLYSVKDPYDPHENVDAGSRHLRWLIERYKGKVELVLAAYNAGEKAVDRYQGIPPYDETKQYIQRVLRMYRSFSSST